MRLNLIYIENLVLESRYHTHKSHLINLRICEIILQLDFMYYYFFFSAVISLKVSLKLSSLWILRK